MGFFSSAVAIPLPGGWSFLGNPFSFPVAWESLTVDGVPVNEDSLVTGMFRWIAEDNEYDPVPPTTLVPFEGYWIYNFGPDAVLSVPPVEAVAPAAPEVMPAVIRLAVADWGMSTP